MGNFEFDGEKYKLASKHQKEWGDRLIAGLKLTGIESVLDLGCGDGVLTEKIAALVPGGEVLGIDASIGMIRTAEKLERGNLRFARMDINDMDFSNRFDVIYSNAALHWIKDHRRLLANSFRALKKGGVILWNFAADGTCATFNKAVKAVMKKSPYRKYFSGFEWPWFMPSKAEYEKLAAEPGFRTFSVEYENADRFFAGREEMINWIDQPSIVPFLARVPNEKKTGFRQEVVDGVIAAAEQPDGTCFMQFRRLKVSAVK